MQSMHIYIYDIIIYDIYVYMYISTSTMNLSKESSTFLLLFSRLQNSWHNYWVFRGLLGTIPKIGWPSFFVVKGVSKKTTMGTHNLHS